MFHIFTHRLRSNFVSSFFLLRVVHVQRIPCCTWWEIYRMNDLGKNDDYVPPVCRFTANTNLIFFFPRNAARRLNMVENVRRAMEISYRSDTMREICFSHIYMFTYFLVYSSSMHKTQRRCY